MAAVDCGLANSGAWGDSDDEISTDLQPPLPLGARFADPPTHRMDESLLSPASFFARRDVTQPCVVGSAPVRLRVRRLRSRSLQLQAAPAGLRTPSQCAKNGA